MSSREFRPDLYVLARIIEALVNNGPMKRTKLAIACGLSYDKFERYLEWMVRKNLVIIDGDGFVRLTKDGERTYEELVQWIKRYVGSLRINRI
jgi:predicted transcriptional regulator